MESIKNIIPQVIKPLSSGNGGQASVADLWHRLYGPEKTTSVVEFKDGCLTVHVDCSARLVKLNLNKTLYLEELSRKNPDIKNIRFKVGKIT